MLQNKLLIALFLSSLTLSMKSQTYQDTLIGLVDKNLIQINRNDAGIGQTLPILNIPDTDSPIRITWCEPNQCFYGLVKIEEISHIIRISASGIYTVLSSITVPDETVYFMEGIAFNRFDGQLYVSASLNGSISMNDFHSESFVRVDTTSFIGTILGTFSHDSPDEAEADIIIFDDEGNLYYADGRPSSGSGFFRIYQQDNEFIDSSTLIYSSNYLVTSGFTIKDNRLYYSSERALYALDLENYQQNQLGTIFDNTEFNGELVRGITWTSNVEGCTDPGACNYNVSANIDDGSCTENDCLGICDGDAVEGCTENSAINYDSEADCDDGSCQFDYTICDCNGNAHSPYAMLELGDGNPNDTDDLNFNCETWGYDCEDIIGSSSEDPFDVCLGNMPPSYGCICLTEGLDLSLGNSFLLYDTLEHAGNKIIETTCVNVINVVPYISGGCPIVELCFSLNGTDFECLNLLEQESYYYSGDLIEFQTTVEAQLVLFYYTTTDDTSDTYSIYVPECIVGVEEKTSSKILAFPNPVDNTLNIFIDKELAQNLKVKLFDSTGEMVRYIDRSRNGESLSIDISDLANGIYWSQFRV